MTKIWYSIGVMSGTSLDGVDIAYVKFENTILNGIDNWKFHILFAKTYSYSDKWLNKLKDAFYYSKNDLEKIDLEYGEYLSKLINQFRKEKAITNVDFIASHGHTIHHKPNEGYTLQIGNGKIIAKNTQIKTIYDFRTQDVNLGGQGAPLVPIGDKLLFSDYKYCLNLGGFANISFNKIKDKTLEIIDKTLEVNRIAYDICAVNTVMNHYVNKLGFEYDDKGNIAKSGKINKDLLNKLNALEFFKMDYPKSLGIEYVNDKLFPLIDSFKLDIKDILRTYIEHIAIQIINNLIDTGNLLITGGGTFNTFLIDRIKELSSNDIVIPNEKVIDYKEALIFAFLGLLKLENKVNCLKSVTGASKNHSSGEIAI